MTPCSVCVVTELHLTNNGPVPIRSIAFQTSGRAAGFHVSVLDVFCMGMIMSGGHPDAVMIHNATISTTQREPLASKRCCASWQNKFCILMTNVPMCGSQAWHALMVPL